MAARTGDGSGFVSVNQSSVFTVVLAALVVGIAVASRPGREGEASRRRPAAIVLLIVAALVAGLCLFLASRHGG
jgi:FtsH-binding integral membrane protein